MDPAQAYIQRFQNRQRSSVTGDSNGSEDSGTPPEAPTLESAGGPRTTTTTSLVAYGQLVKHHHGLKDQSAVALDQFCEASSSDERQVLMFAEMIMIHALLKRQTKNESYTIPSTLDVTLKAYAVAFLLGHKTVAIRGLNVSGHIMNAMRELHILELPNAKDVAHTDIVLKAIGGKLTYFRNVIKTKVRLEPRSRTRQQRCNIAELTHAIISNLKCGIQPTLQLYMRIAFLRFCVVSYGALSDEAFWPKVDEVMDTWRRAIGTEVEISQVLTDVYEDDKRKYGKPQDTNHTSVDISLLPPWQKTLANHAAKVQRDTSKETTGKKRGYVEMTTGTPDPEDEDGRGSGGAEGSGSG
ncbi:hypothetical protein DFH09DRAFT_901390 [Mycena vulgaris]|nr:hypothetical protein DFH09DRAFT_901390 [Mycena vulgaris]